jgi:hypothetical protein
VGNDKKVSRLSKEPVLTANAIIGLVIAALLVIQEMGWIDLTPNQLESWKTLVTIAIPILITVGGSYILIRPKVTPMVDPRDKDGNKLTPEGQ